MPSMMRLQNLICFVLLGAMTLTVFVAARSAAAAAPRHDLAGYWAAARLASQNPYSVPLVKGFYLATGNGPVPTMVRNPPWAILFVLPLAWFSYPTAFALWALLSIVLIAGCARAAWMFYSPEPSLAPAFLSLVFGPTILLIELGQLTVLVLLGVVLFLFFVRNSRDWLAGASLMLLVLKPHITLFFLLAVFLWAMHRKRWAILLSGALAVAVATVAVLAINPHIFAQYFAFASQFAHEMEMYPNLGGVVAAVSGRHSWSLLPELLGFAWFVFYWRKHRATWDWRTHGVLVLVVSVVCSYHSFPYDEVLFLPALIAVFAKGNRRMFLACFAATNLGYAFFLSKMAERFGFGAGFLWWTASAWLLTYVVSRNRVVHAATAAEMPAPIDR